MRLGRLLHCYASPLLGGECDRAGTGAAVVLSCVIDSEFGGLGPVRTVSPSRSEETDVRHLLTDRRAVSALEYGLIASLIAVAIITTLVALGMHLSRIFNSIGSYL